MGFVQKDALRSIVISYVGVLLGYVNKGVLFIYILSTEQIGLVNLIVGVGVLFAQVANLGTFNAVSKFSPFFNDYKERKQSFFILNFSFVFIGILLFSLIAVLLKNQIVLHYSETSPLFVEYYYWIIPLGIANVYFVLFDAILRAQLKNILSTFLSEFLLRFLVLVLLLLLYFKIINFFQFFVFHCFVYFIPTLILFIYLIQTGELLLQKSSLKISKKFKRIIISFSLYGYSNAVGALMIVTIDSLMIARYIGLKETGVYTMIIYLTSAIQIPYKSLMRIIGPLVPQYWKEKKIDKIQNLYKQTSSISQIIVLYAFLLCWCNIDALFSFLPSEYLAGKWVFLFLMIGKIIDMYLGLNGWILVTSKKNKVDIIFTMILLILVVVLNLWLIPLYGIIGVSIATGFSMIIYNLLRMGYLFFHFKIHPFEKNQFSIFILFFVILLIHYSISLGVINWVVLVVIRSFLISLLFVGSIVLLKLNIDMNDYLNKFVTIFFKKNKE